MELNRGFTRLRGDLSNVQPIIDEIAKYGLFKYAVELEMFGVTCVPPEITGIGEDFLGRLRSAVLEVASKRFKVDLTAEDYRTTQVKIPTNYVGNHFWILYENDVFAEAAMNPVGLALVRYLLGASAVLSLTGFLAKPSDPTATQKVLLHTDQVDPPGTVVQSGINVSILCSDYLEIADGPTVFVPGSHKWGRGPMPYEVDPDTTPSPLVTLPGRAGSMLIWAGATWHGSIPRTKPGLRLTILQFFARRHVRPQNLHDEPEAEALMDRMPGLDRILGRREHQTLFPVKMKYNRTNLDNHFGLTRDPYR